MNNEDFEYCMGAEINRARRKFPANTDMMSALTEEVGELAKALIDHKHGKGNPAEVFAEAVQVAAMAYRVAMEGSAEFPYKYDDAHYRGAVAEQPAARIVPQAAALDVDRMRHDLRRARLPVHAGHAGDLHVRRPGACGYEHLL